MALGTAAFPIPFTPVPPLGDLIYTGSDNHVLVTPTDVNSLTLPLNAGGTLTLVGTPSDPSQQLIIAILDPGGNVIATATAAAAGQNVVLETVPLATTGTYTIQISDAGGALGVYDITAYLNSYLKQGTSNFTIGTATDISSSSYVLGPGNADRLAVVGSLPTDVVQPGDAFVTARFYGFYNSAPTIADVLRVNGQGQITKIIAINDGLYYSVGAPQLSPYDNMLYVGVTTNQDDSNGMTDGELLKIDPLTGQQVGVISLPADPAANFWYYPYGFAAAPDGTFWIAQPNSQNIIHVDGTGSLIQSYSVSGTVPESASVGTDGNVYFTGLFGPSGTGIYQLNPSTGSWNYAFFSPDANITSTAPNGGGIWSGDFNYGALRWNYDGSLGEQNGYFGTNMAQYDASGNTWTANWNYWELFRQGPGFQFQLGISAPGAIGVTTWGIDNPNSPPQDTQDFYKFDLIAGQSATIVAKSLNGKSLQITLVDGSGNVLATGVGGSTNVTQDIENFVAPTAGTYYVEITGDPGVQYSLTVTRSANFDIEPNDTINQSQNLDGTNGALGALNRAARSRSGRTTTASTSTARTAAVCHRTPTRRWAATLWPKRSTSSSGCSTRPPVPSCSTRRSQVSSGKAPAATPTSSTTTLPTAGTSRPSTARTADLCWPYQMTRTRSTGSIPSTSLTWAASPTTTRWASTRTPSSSATTTSAVGAGWRRSSRSTRPTPSPAF